MVSATVRDTGPARADVTVRASLGDRVRVDVTGDELPASRRRTLVPIEQLRSVEEEVIEDASRNIEQYLRLEGYRLAEAPSSRRRDGGVLVIAFAVRRGPLHVLESIGVDGVTAAAVRPKCRPCSSWRLANLSSRRAWRRWPPRWPSSYRVRGFADVRVSPRLISRPMTADQVPVTVRLEVVGGTAHRRRGGRVRRRYGDRRRRT